MIMEYKVGDKVTWRSSTALRGRGGHNRVFGIIVKVNRTTYGVLEASYSYKPNTMWSVPKTSVMSEDKFCGKV
jgi:hypothetical protein